MCSVNVGVKSLFSVQRAEWTEGAGQRGPQGPGGDCGECPTQTMSSFYSRGSWKCSEREWTDTGLQCQAESWKILF